MASITQNSVTKKWEFVFDYYENGKRKQVRRKGIKSKREANDLLVTLQKEVQDGEYVQINMVTLGDFMKYWLENIRILEIDPTSYYNNGLYFKNHIISRIGYVKLQDLNPLICQNFVSELHKSGYARNTIDRVCTLIKLALDKAVSFKYIKENHMRKVTLPKREKSQLKVWNF